MGYTPTWSLQDLYEEYTRPARFIRNRKVVTAHPFYSPDKFYNDQINAFLSDGLRSLLTLRGKIDNMEEYTLRYAGHMHSVKRLLDSYHERDIPLEEHKELFVDAMDKLCTPRGKDWCILDMQVETYRGEKIEYKMHVLGTNQQSGMSKCTAGAAQAFARLVLEGVYDEPGCHAPEDIGGNQKAYNRFFECLSERGVDLLV